MMKTRKTNPKPLMTMGEYNYYREERRKRILALLYLVLFIAGSLLLSILIG